MKYVSCLLLESGMAFGKDDIRPCTCNPFGDIFWAKEYYGGPFNVEKYLSLRKKYTDMMKAGTPPEQCKGCYNLEYKDWNDEPSIEFIVIGNETKCSCNCFYCWFAEEKEYFNNYQAYDFMPILKTLQEHNLLKKTTLDIVGGECTEYPKGKLRDIIDFAKKNNCKMHFYSSGINFSEEIAEALNCSIASIVVSIDSGTKQMYEKIKRVKAFDRVWENMAKYAKAGTPNNEINKGFVILKYIIIPNLNDNIDEIKAFMQKAKEANCKKIRISVEYDWWRENCDKPMPQNLWKILDYTEECKKELNIEYIENAIYLWRKRMKEDKNYKGLNPCSDLIGC